ncbi:hypothetical protein NHX12_023494 [Muraenolepis orangiensis]|uniref:Uncharacterized protein n=1 Tax=Muraenolepis orangiensis TaxID=630683 RepID=A0A9Q0ITV8_9TELE|nr:hypothetical protein NHX12_023494 [Muraenolepis orangiensis]
MVVYLKNSINSLLSIFKKKAGPRRNEDQKGLSVHYRASQHYPENVFIQGNRSQYLEDLHTEAQQGLKILQQEEHYIDGSFPDNRSVSSTNTLRPDQDVYSLDSGCSPEPGITAGTSTFKPLNSTETVKRPDKGRKKVRRTTIMGIPQQVQRELALQRNSTFQPMASPRLTNGRQRVNDGLSGALVIPTVNGETPVAIQEGARVNLSDLEVSREDQLLRKHLQAVYQEEQLSNPQDLGYHLRTTISQRPKSLAVPGMTTSSSAFNFLHEPQGPVMSISPQATYLSKIIPNAVLPASVEVIQINCGGSRSLGGHGGGVRAVSKSSLMSADSSGSPGSSRRSDGDGSDADDAQKSTTALGFRSRSSSAEMMIMPNGSTAERSADALNLQMTIGLTEQGGPSAETDRGHDLVSICSSLSWVSSPGKSQGSDCEASGSASGGEDMRSGHSFTRNLSIVKTKLPPAPPQRTNSLHINKMRKNSKDLLVVKDLTDSKTRSEGSNSERTMSPSSGYSKVWAHNKHSVKLLFGPPSYSTRLVSMKTSSSQTTEWQTEANQGALTVDVIQMSESKEAVSQEKSLLEEILETAESYIFAPAGRSEGDMVFDGGDEVDFPPPPPFVTEILPDVIDGCTTATKGPDQPANIPQASSPPADHKCPSVNFRRQPSLANREARSKEILSRHKSVPIPKEDANIPLVTPSLLQMVRLRTVSMIEDEMSAVPVEDHSMPSNGGLQLPQDNCPAPTSGPQGTPQKPIRKSLSYKSAHTVKTSSVTRNSPSMRLQEAIRMKTAAMSSRDCLPSRLGSRLLMSGGFGESGTIDPLKSPASTASFIFSKSTKKVVIETAASSPEAQAGLKQSLAAELIQTTDRTKGGTVSNGGVKWDKVPPPVAKKPAHGSSAPSNNDESRREVNTEAIGGVTGNIPSSSETTMTTVTPDTIETLF